MPVMPDGVPAEATILSAIPFIMNLAIFKFKRSNMRRSRLSILELDLNYGVKIMYKRAIQGRQALLENKRNWL